MSCTLHRIPLIALAGAVLLFLVTSTPARSGNPSPESWRDITIYQVMTDRFFDGEPSNNNLGGSYDPADGWRTHGGDFQGLEARLDYIVGLGVDAVWISPVLINANGEYHGYAARELYTISPQMGGLAGLQSFVQAAHARGLYVVIDVVTNHLGNLVGSFDPGYPDHDPSGGYSLSWWDQSNQYPPPFNDLSLFHAHGEIQDFNDPEQYLGELFGLDDLKTELPAIRDILVDAYAQLIADTDCDGFRIDTVKHVEFDFWPEFASRIRTEAALEGKDNFLLMGEVFDGWPPKVGSYTGTMNSPIYALNSVTWFPMTFTARWIFSGDGVPAALNSVMADSIHYDPSVRWQLGNFYDNHDIGRMAAQGQAWQDDTLLRQALTWLLTWPGMPILYYGTEQEYDGGGDPWNREDLWDGDWDFGPSQGDGFNRATPLYTLTRRLQDLRHDFASIRRGDLQVLAADEDDPGALVYLRRDPSDADGDVLVAMNTSWEDTTITVATRWHQGEVVQDRLFSGREFVIGPGNSLELPMGTRAVWVLTRREPQTRLTVLGASPHHDGVVQHSSQVVELHFDRPMPQGGAGWFSFDPAMAFSLQWRNQHTAILKPSQTWIQGAQWSLRVDAALSAQDGSTLGEDFEMSFHVELDDAGLTLPPGFTVEVLSPFNYLHPLGLELLPANVWNTPPRSEEAVVGDVRRRRLLSLRPNQRVSTWATRPEFLDVILSVETDPSGAFGGGLLVTTPNQLLSQDASGIWSTLWLPPTFVEAVLVGAGNLAGYAYLSSPAAGGLYRVDPSGSATLWASGMGDARGFDQAPTGHPLEDELIVCISDLNPGGVGELRRVPANGNSSTWVTSALLDGAMDLRVAPIGPFGAGNVIVGDVLEERLLVVSPQGDLSVLISGFENLYGSDFLSFGQDGALYVLDPGGAEGFTNNGSTAEPRLLRISAVSATDAPPARREGLSLRAHPNPFNPRVELRYETPADGRVRVEIFDAAGRRVARVLDQWRPAGAGRLLWTANDVKGRPLASGVYHARMRFEDGSAASVKLTLVR